MDFPAELSRVCPIFDYMQSIDFVCPEQMTLMRVAYQFRYKIPFSYTLEMSVGGSRLVKPCKQFTPNDYRKIGASTAYAIFKFLVKNTEIWNGIQEFYYEKK